MVLGQHAYSLALRRTTRGTARARGRCSRRRQATTTYSTLKRLAGAAALTGTLEWAVTGGGNGRCPSQAGTRWSMADGRWSMVDGRLGGLDRQGRGYNYVPSLARSVAGHQSLDSVCWLRAAKAGTICTRQLLGVYRGGPMVERQCGLGDAGSEEGVWCPWR
ncbi:hypothetical protein CHU98_g2101 [Xylaria longipes]|nr:hypothetical protein CHU98_g2101 [Xylaria longipes]